MKIKDIEKTADRIRKAIKNKERIIVYGDADLDGTASVVIMKEIIMNIGGKVDKVYFPDYNKEKHGINYTALESLKSFSPALLIAVDLGTANIEEIKKANEMGFEVLVIDHHDVVDELPPAFSLVNPKRKDDDYPFKYFAAVGLVLRLGEELIGNMSISLRKDLVSLAALATIADMMPQEDENSQIIDEGMSCFAESKRPGISIFFESKKFNNLMNNQEIVSKIIALANVRDLEGIYPAGYMILTAKDEKEAKDLMEDLIIRCERRQNRITGAVLTLEEKILNNPEEEIIFEGDPSWDLSIISSIASAVCNKYGKPTFIFPKKDGEIRGTMRCPKGVNGVEALKSCSHLLITYGGHPPAAGYMIDSKNLGEFKQCLINHFLERNVSF